MTPVLWLGRELALARTFLHAMRSSPKGGFHGVRHYSAWRNSLLRGTSSLDESWPWWVFDAVRFLEGYLTREMRVFEFGSGGSTLFFAWRAREVVSVEHDPAWYARLLEAVRGHPLENVTLVLREAEPLANADAGQGQLASDQYRSAAPLLEGFSFRNYVRTIDSFPEGYFDVVAVDGRSRCACVRHAVSRVRPGGVLLLDDSERPRYAEVREMPVHSWESHVFHGPGPHNPYFWETTIWTRPVGR